MDKNIVRSCLLPLLFSSMLVFLVTLNANATSGKLRIDISNDRISVAIKDCSLMQVMDEVQKKTSIRVEFYDEDAKSRKVNANFSNLSYEAGLKRILRDNYVFYFVRDKQKKTLLSKIKIGDKSLQADTLQRTNILSYGSGTTNIGVISEGEGAQIGPASFYADSDGTLYIADTVNNRIQVYSEKGEHLSTIPLLGKGPNDITLDKNGNIYVYDVNGTVYQYGSTGQPIAQVAMDETQWQTLGPMHIVDSKLYARANDVGDVLLATVKEGKIQLPESDKVRSSEIVETGVIGGTTGNRYTAVLHEKARGAQIRIDDKSSVATTFIPLTDIVSAEVLGEDSSGNFYVKTEAYKDNQIHVEVSKFDDVGDYSGTIAIAGDDYDFWSIRTLTVSDNGNIYQMMPAQNGVVHGEYRFE